MEIGSIYESSWKGALVVVRFCSQCKTRIYYADPKFCLKCGHKFNKRPARLSCSLAAEILEAHYAAKEGK